MKEFGALPHLTIARNDRTSKIEYLTNLTIEEYDKVWSRFGSEFWEFKKTIFMKKRKEFCYAGDWLLLIDLATGQAKHCYRSLNKQNIFENPDQPIKFKAIGKCPEPHCYNGHALLTLGCIPHITDVGYGDIRNRKKASGGEWLQPELKAFFNSKLCESNNEYGKCKKAAIMLNAELIILRQAISNVIKKYTKG